MAQSTKYSYFSSGLTDGDEDLADESDGDVLVDEEVDEDTADESDDPHDQVRRRGEQAVLKQKSQRSKLGVHASSPC